MGDVVDARSRKAVEHLKPQMLHAAQRRILHLRRDDTDTACAGTERRYGSERPSVRVP